MSSEAWQGMKPTQAKRKRRGNGSWHNWHQARLSEERLGWKQAVKGGGLILPNSHIIQFKSWKGYLQLEGYGSSASLYFSWVFLITDKRFISAVQCGLQKCLLMNCRRGFLSLLKTGGYLSLWKTKWRLIGSLILITFLGLHSWSRHISRAVF